MSAFDSSPFPLVGLKPVSNAQNQWVGLAFQMPADAAPEALQALLSHTDGESQVLAALDCVIPLPDPLRLELSHLDTLPANRLVFTIPVARFADAAVQQRCKDLSARGVRLLADGEADIQAARAGVRGMSFDCASALPSPVSMMTVPGPHLARGIGNEARLNECGKAGFNWFSGSYALQATNRAGTDGTSRKRLLSLLGLLARDADSRELETLLKQDPALSFHLLKLVNSAAFAPSAPINNFGQAINVLGRRQLQRWLQLLLYARQQVDGPANALLPLAALRAAQMESLCKLRNCSRDEQDMAFMVGVFSLLDVLLAMPMTEIVAALNLDLDIVRALLDRAGALGDMLKVVELHQPQASALRDVGIDNETYWRSLLQAYHWALQVSRNV
jgi:EAL and modified HD-GYP domain-containing signal transduction protein